MSYKQLSLAERYYIEVERKKKVSQSNIAESVGRSQGAISHELKRITHQFLKSDDG
jgi:IS30 family transposase